MSCCRCRQRQGPDEGQCARLGGHDGEANRPPRHRSAGQKVVAGHPLISRKPRSEHRDRHHVREHDRDSQSRSGPSGVTPGSAREERQSFHHQARTRAGDFMAANTATCRRRPEPTMMPCRQSTASSGAGLCEAYCPPPRPSLRYVPRDWARRGYPGGHVDLRRRVAGRAGGGCQVPVSDSPSVGALRWRRHYNEVRPHSSLGHLTPAEDKRKHLADPMDGALAGDAGSR